MKHILLFLLFSISIQSIIAQDADIYKKITKAFQENYNTQNIDAIFDMYSLDSQEEMTKEGITQFITGCYGQFGNLNTLKFIETTENVYSYSAEFDKGTLSMEIQLTTEGKIATIQLM